MKWMVYIILSGIFLFSPYYKGLYFNKSTYGISIAFFVLFFILFIRLAIKKELNSHKIALPIIAIPLCYLLSFFFAENPQGAMESIINWSAYASFFLLLFWSASEGKIRAVMPIIFQLTGCWIAVLTLLVYYGVVDYRSAIVADRFAGVFQYPNTFGMVMAVFGLFSLIMLTTRKISLSGILLFSLPLIAFTVCFIQSLSRGMFLVFPICWFLSLTFFKLKQQIEYILYSAVFFCLSILVYQSMENGEILHLTYPGLVILFISTLFSPVLVYFIKTFLMERNLKWLTKISGKKGSHYFLPLSLLLFILLLGLDLTNNGLVFNQLPNQLQTRIETTNLEAATAKERLIFIEDALSISKKSPFIGFGGEAWVSIYKNHQQFPYLSNKVHNGYLEMIIDIGWIGFLVFIGVFGFFYWHIFKKYRSNDENSNTIQISVLISSLALLLHSFLDFNFSYSTVWLIILWLVIMGISEIPEQQRVKNLIRFGWIPPIGLGIFLTIVGTSLFFSYRFIMAEQHFFEFKQNNSYLIKKQAIEAAITDNPFSSIYKMNLIGLELSKFQRTRDEQIKNELLEDIEELTNIEKSNSSNYLKAGEYAESVGENELALTYYSKGLNLDHYEKLLYENSIKLKVSLADRLFIGSESERLLKSAVDDYEKNVKWMNDFNEHAPKNPEKFNSRNFKVTDPSNIYGSKAYIKQKDYQSALKAAERISENSIQKKRALALIILDLEKMGQLKQANELAGQYAQKYPDFFVTLNLLRERENQ